MKRDSKGFTLVELMAVLAILAILAALVYPSYTQQVVKARRIEAQLALLDIMQRQEQYRALHHS
ncbi:type IV pilin protein, partial [Stenotrophomonas maltophilia]